MSVSIYIGRLINPGIKIAEGVRITINKGRIASIQTGSVPSREDVHCPSAICSPALINSHDHLKYTWPEHVGNNPPYENSYTWLPELYEQANNKFLRYLELRDLYWLGNYKCIFSGVSTVVNHCRPLQKLFFSSFPVFIFDDFCREIFVRYDPRVHQMGVGTKLEATYAKNRNRPFVVHIAEGTNGHTRVELDLLQEKEALFEGAVLVHGLNFSEDDIENIANARASVVWCPVSNYFLFGKVAPVKNFLRKKINVALGTDSTCTGGEDLLHEMRFAFDLLTGFISRISAAEVLFSLVTKNAARAFKQSKYLGEIKAGAYADLLIFESDSNNPYLGLIDLKPENIILLTSRGKWLLGTNELTRYLPCGYKEHNQICINETLMNVVGDPVGLVKRVAKQCKSNPNFFPLGKILQIDQKREFYE